MKENEVRSDNVEVDIRPEIEIIKVDEQPNSYTTGDDYRFKIKIKENVSNLFLMVKLRYMGDWKSDDKINLYGSISMRNDLNFGFMKILHKNLLYNTVSKKLILSDCKFDYSDVLVVLINQIEVY